LTHTVRGQHSLQYGAVTEWGDKLWACRYKQPTHSTRNTCGIPTQQLHYCSKPRLLPSYLLVIL